MRREKLHEKALRPSGSSDGNKATDRSRLLKIFNILLGNFGKRGWWPVTKRGFKPEYRLDGRKNTSSKEMFEICIGAVLTQNTAWTNVERVIENLNREKFMSPGKMASACLAALHKAVRPSGYYRQKSIKLKKLSAYILKKHSGKLKSWFEKSDAGALREELLSLHGIGPETADSMILYAAGKPKFIADTYTIRIFSRLGFENIKTYSNTQDFFERNLPADLYLFREYHALIVELGKNYCKKSKPLCGECPLEKICEKKMF